MRRLQGAAPSAVRTDDNHRRARAERHEEQFNRVRPLVGPANLDRLIGSRAVFAGSTESLVAVAHRSDEHFSRLIGHEDAPIELCIVMCSTSPTIVVYSDTRTHLRRVSAVVITVVAAGSHGRPIRAVRLKSRLTERRQRLSQSGRTHHHSYNSVPSAVMGSKLLEAHSGRPEQRDAHNRDDHTNDGECGQGQTAAHRLILSAVGIVCGMRGILERRLMSGSRARHVRPPCRPFGCVTVVDVVQSPRTLTTCVVSELKARRQTERRSPFHRRPSAQNEG